MVVKQDDPLIVGVATYFVEGRRGILSFIEGVPKEWKPTPIDLEATIGSERLSEVSKV